MAKEIERKFLVADDSWRSGSTGCRYTQGYLSRDPERIVRVRQAGNFAFITIKGITRAQHGRNSSIPFRFRRASLDGVVPSPPDREDSLSEYRGSAEVDEFHGDNQGLSCGIELARGRALNCRPGLVRRCPTTPILQRESRGAPFKQWNVR
jgi:CYTH domain-containing protein